LGLQSGFGDHEGLLGCLDAEGRLYIVTSNDGPSSLGRRHGTLVCQSTAKSPLLSHVAMAGNGRVAATFKQAPNAGLTHVVEFEGLTVLLEYYRNPTGEENYPASHWMVGGKAKQLLGNIATFALLTERGEVWTWGDPRHQSLGRKITNSSEGGVSMTSGAPGLVDALGGVKIAKIAMGGWMSAAVSEEQSAYIWGSGMPGAGLSIRIKDYSVSEVAMIELPGEEVGSPFDVADVGVGEGHIVVLVKGGRAFGVGNNENAQLGLPGSEKFVPDW
ncbi:RCC1/BLIP-II, partial [Polychaeton citri CBS 116435]